MRPPRPRISACIVVFNEATVLERCLRSLDGAVDEIVVVHDGPCSDESLDIARRHTGKVSVRPHIGIAEGHRIATLEVATGDWILQIDADEFLSEPLRQALPGLVADEAVDAYEFVWPIWDGARYLTQGWPYKGALFRKDKITYLDFPQEPLRTTGQTRKVPLVLEHQPLGNKLTWKHFRKSSLARARIQAKELTKQFSQIPKYNVADTDWPPRLNFARRHAYLYPLIGAYVFGNNLMSGSWKTGWRGLRQSFLWAIYNGAVYRYLWQFQRAARRSRA
jgi:glycosyltransferase involved in cell wall biosynthesis